MANIYKPPTADEIREFLITNSLTGAAAAGMVHVDPRTFRRYMAHTNAKPIPFSVWFTLRTKARVAVMERAGRNLRKLEQEVG